MKNFAERFITFKLGNLNLSRASLISQPNLCREPKAKSCHLEVEEEIEAKDGKGTTLGLTLIMQNARHMRK